MAKQDPLYWVIFIYTYTEMESHKGLLLLFLVVTMIEKTNARIPPLDDHHDRIPSQMIVITLIIHQLNTFDKNQNIASTWLTPVGMIHKCFSEQKYRDKRSHFLNESHSRIRIRILIGSRLGHLIHLF
ncbi:hypothetical protein AC249_AIPGENE21569 [Exaiptasia diaphana]|nr:hypothetical protein AC249_AIPGENE21569 [Exaiptasia diaphana]